MTSSSTVREALQPAPALESAIYRLALLGLCGAYLQGGVNKALDFPAAVQEMQHFGLPLPALLALATVVLELAAPVMILTGYRRGLAAVLLACFTLVATFLANRYWTMAQPVRGAVANAFYEHLGLVGGFALVALQDWRARHA